MSSLRFLSRHLSGKSVQFYQISRTLSSTNTVLSETKPTDIKPKQGQTPGPKATELNVPGFSKNILSVPTTETGPGASKAGNYKNPEYFCYNPTSYFEAEIEMAKYRLPQPSALSK